MIFLVRTTLLSTLLLLSPLVASAAEPVEPDGLTAREAGAVRKALYGLNTSLLRNGREQTILQEAEVGTPSLTSEERERIATHLFRHVPTMVEVQEVLNLRQRWRKRSVELFVFWWHPVYKDADGVPARSPTTLEAARLEEVARAAGRRLAVEPPAWMPYRIDPRAESARTHGRNDLRWGVWAPDAKALDAVVEAVARERGGLPGLWKPLGRLLGTCHEDEVCRAGLLTEAERSVSEAGLVPVLEVLTAGTLGDLEDPAFASSLLFTDLILREHRPEELGALLEGLEPGLGSEEVRRVLRASLGSTPERFDRRLAKTLRDGRRDRLGR